MPGGSAGAASTSSGGDDGDDGGAGGMYAWALGSLDGLMGAAAAPLDAGTLLEYILSIEEDAELVSTHARRARAYACAAHARCMPLHARSAPALRRLVCGVWLARRAPTAGLRDGLHR
jgi:hypothetical protein